MLLRGFKIVAMSKITWNVVLWEANEISMLTPRSCETVDVGAADALIRWAGTLPQGGRGCGSLAMS